EALMTIGEQRQLGTTWVRLKQQEVTMSGLRMESCLLLGAAVLAACSDRNTPTAPSARPLAATAAVERPYTWSFTCQSPKLDFGITARWWWLENSVEIAGTRLERFC